MPRPSEARLSVALVAALLLVLQTVAGAFASGTVAAAPRDAYGNPLCITSGIHDGQELPAKPAHGMLPGCCTLACGMAAVLGPVPVDVVGVVRLHAALLAPVAPVEGLPTHPPEHSPGNPRAPPLS